MSAYYSTQFNGMTAGVVATGWTVTAGTRWIIAAVAQQGSDAFQCSAGTGTPACYNATLLAGLKENVDVIVQSDRQSGGLYDFRIDFCLGASGSRAVGFSTRIRRTANATDSVEIVTDVLGGSAGSATGSLADGFAWIRRVTLTWSGADALIRVYKLNQDYTWTADYERLVPGADTTSSEGYVGLAAEVTTGRVFLNLMRVAIGQSPYAMLTRPFADVVPFRASRDGNHRLRVRGICGNSPTAIEGRFIPDGVSEATIPWATIDTAPSTTFDGEIQTTAAGSGTVQIRPADNPTAIDQLEDCIVCLVIACAGQSNAAGRAVANGGFTPSGDIGYALIWPSNVTPSNPTGNQYWRASTTGEADFKWMTQSSTGTPWPEVATALSAELGLHVAWIGHAEGSTTLVSGTPSWADGGTDWERFELNLARSGISGVNAVVWWQGEGDANGGTTESAYAAALEALRLRIVAIFDDYEFVMLPCTLGQISLPNITNDTEARTLIDPIRAAIGGLVDTLPAYYAWGANVSTYDLAQGTGSPDSLHFKNADAVTYAAGAWSDAILEHFQMRNIRPRAVRCIFEGPTHQTVFLDYDRAIVKGGTNADLDSFRVLVNGSEVTYAATASGSRVTIVLTSAPNVAHSVRIIGPTGNQGCDGATTAGVYVADAADTDYPALITIRTVTQAASARRSRNRRGRERRANQGL